MTIRTPEAQSLETHAEAFVATQRNGRHLLRTRDWALHLQPEASEALRLAALLHDVDRHAGDIPIAEQIAAWEDQRQVAEHAKRSARLATQWLRSEGVNDDLAQAVERLIELHEVGGTLEADVLQASDSLSFLEVNPAQRWVQEGLADRDTAERKLTWMYERIRVAEARVLARPLLDEALTGLTGQDRTHDSAPAERARRQANGGRAHGNTR
jgi:HD domain